MGEGDREQLVPPVPKRSGSELFSSPVQGLLPVCDLGPSHLLPKAGEALPDAPALRTDELCVEAVGGLEIGLSRIKVVEDSREE